MHFSRVTAVFPLNSLDLTVVVPHPRFPVQGHILSTGGDALRDEPETSQLHSHTNIRNLSPGFVLA